MKIAYLPIEPYPERYTEMLCGWVEKRWGNIPGVELNVIRGESLGGGISTGRVLDAHGRAHWSCTQVAALAARLYGFTPEDVLYFDDLFTPGYEAVPYILEQLPAKARPRIYARNHAQSVDPDDFTFGMRRWMRRYEQMVSETASGIICASSVHKQMMQAALLDQAPIYVLGLPYDADDVRRRVYTGGTGVISELPQRPQKVVFSSRLDAEKNPHFMLGIAEKLNELNPESEFVICTGAQEVRSNDPSVVERVRDLEAQAVVRVARGLTKAGYYFELSTARVQLNTSLQDFVSYTAIEASTLGTPTLAPAFRSFPETLRNESAQLYAPWCIDEAVRKLQALLTLEATVVDVGWLSRVQHRTLDRILWLFRGPHTQPPEFALSEWWTEP